MAAPVSAAADPMQSSIDAVWLWALQLRPTVDVASPLAPACLSFALYTAFCVPFLIIEFTRPKWALAYKVQPNVRVTVADLRKCLSNLAMNELFFVFPLSALKYLDEPELLPTAGPRARDLLFHIAGALFVFDLLFYVSHRLLHTRFLYKHVHYIHHRYHSPYVLVTQYLHPGEMLMVGLCGASQRFIFGMHPMTECVWIALITWTSVEHHCGYDMPLLFDFTRLTGGFYAGSRWHDWHHRKPNSNYGAMFSYLDRIFGSMYVDPKSDKLRD